MQDSGYFWGAVFSSLSIFAVIGILWAVKHIQNIQQWLALYRLSIHTGMNVLLFSKPIMYEGSSQLTVMLEQTKKTPTLLILNTPGGSIFDVSLIARRIHANRGNITAVISNYSMSGGTVLALASGRLLMDKFACLGPTDPQLGYFWKNFSSRAWREIIAQKGKKASDESIAMNVYSQQYDKSIRILLSEIGVPPMAVERMTSGEIEHGYQFLPTELQRLGIKAEILDDDTAKLTWATVKGDPKMCYLIDQRNPVTRLFKYIFRRI